MSIPSSELPNQTWLGDHFYKTALQTSLKEFVHQFALLGSSIFWVDSGQQNPWQISYGIESSAHAPLLEVEFVGDWQRLAAASPPEIVCIEDRSLPYHLYGCVCNSTPKSRWYLLCWNHTALSDHQRYGLSLYVQAVRQQLCSYIPGFDGLSVNEVLQRTRHQLRTPLSIILLYGDLLKTAAMDRRSQEWLENLQSMAKEMYTSLDHLTESTTSPDRNLGEYDLRQLWEECCQELQLWIEQKRLKLVYDSQPLWLQVDRWKIKQVFQNLLSNAIAFSPEGGQVTCEWQVFQTEVLIKISDQGPGLSSEDLRSLGTPLYSRRPGGSGLGLSIAKQIILEHRGSLWADNLSDGGAQFYIMLPRNR